MNLFFDVNIAKNYKSSSQKARVLTETWTAQNIFCPKCGSIIKKYENNRPVADFYCPKCGEQFEEKSKSGKFSRKVLGGQYDKIIERLNSAEKPNFFFLQYSESLSVSDFFVLPKSFMIPEIIEQRKPLAKTARRANWVGSNIILPKSGQIFYIKDGKVIDKNVVLNEWQKRAFVHSVDVKSRSWLIDIMNCVAEIKSDEFTLHEMYNFKGTLAELHPNNSHIHDKIRQQLQLLRDRNYIEFLGNGVYRKI